MQNDTLTDRRVWLAIPVENKDEALAFAGLKEDGSKAILWDKEEKLWYAEPNTPIEKIAPYLPDTSLRATGSEDPHEEFSQALQAAGLVIEGLPIMDGKVHRVATLEDKKGRKSGGAYRGFNDRRPAGWFINYHRAEAENVTNWKATGGKTDAITSLHLKAAAKQVQEDSTRAREKMYDENTKKAQGLYERLPVASNEHPYLVRKGISADPALRLTNNNSLVIPIRDVDGHFKSLEYITPDGDKALFKEAPKSGNFFVTGGELRADVPILYAEGYSTAQSIHETTGLPVVMTVDAGNMRTVAGILGERFPTATHVFMADIDHAKKVNKGLLMAQAAAALVPNGLVVTPPFTQEEIKEGLTDFNDLHLSRGSEALSKLLAEQFTEHQILPKEVTMKSEKDDLLTPPISTPETLSKSEAASYEQYFSESEQHSEPELDVMTVQEYAQTPKTPTPESPQESEPTIQPEPSPRPATEQVENLETLNENDPVLRHQNEPKQADSTAENLEDGIAFGPRVPGAGNFSAEDKPSNVDTDALLQRISWEEQNKTVLYKVDDVPAFRDHGNKMTMESPQASQNPDHVLAALLTASRHYGGKIELTGSDEFKHTAIELIAAHNLNVSMKNPMQQALLDEARLRLSEQVEKDSVHASPLTPDLTQSTGEVPESKRPIAQWEPETLTSDSTIPVEKNSARTNEDKADRDNKTLSQKPLVGQLLEHGPAPYQFNNDNSNSYFIKLKTREGERTVWGAELASALKESGVSEGQVLSLQHKGKKMVTVQVPQKNDEGHITGYKERHTHRNHWEIKSMVHPNVRAEIAPTEGEKLSAYDLNKFASIQQAIVTPELLAKVKAVQPIPSIEDKLLWLRPDGRGTMDRGDAMTANRPQHDEGAGKVMLTSYAEDGRLKLHLAKGDGPFLQGIAMIKEKYYNVLASLPNNKAGPDLIINALTSEGLRYVGHAQALNQVEGKSIPRDTLLFKISGDENTQIAKLVKPEDIPTNVHASLGFDKRYSADTEDPKVGPRAEVQNKAQPAGQRPG